MRPATNPMGIAMQFAGRPMARWKHRAEQDLIEYLGAFETAYKAAAALAQRWPSATDIGGESEIPREERDIVFAIVAAHSAVVQQHRRLLAELYAHQQELVSAVAAVPTHWDATKTRQFLERPQLWGMTSEDTEDIERARARGTPWTTLAEDTP